MVPSSLEPEALKFTVSGACPEVGEAVKLAVGASFGCAKADLTVSVARKRKKSVNDSNNFVFIESLHGCGYRFSGISLGGKLDHSLNDFIEKL